MQRNPLQRNLADSLRENGRSTNWTLFGAHASASLNELTTGTALGGRLADLSERSVLIATDDQLAAAISLIELDGVARRMVLYPPGVAPTHLPAIVADAEVDAIVSDRALPEHDALGINLRVQCSLDIRPTENTPLRPHETEWILLTSGTSGAPKAVVHTLASLTAAIKPRGHADPPIVWATFYDIRRYGGLQIFLRAILGGSSLILTDSKEPIADFTMRLRNRGATHVTGTPSHWRRLLWSPSAATIAPQYVRMSGEVADQAIIDSLRATYPHAKVGHAYASTEAGVGFHVDDAREGFPTSFLGTRRDGVEIKVEGGSLRIRSAGNATRYLGPGRGAVADEDGFVDTGDLIVMGGDRCYFAGRTSGVINVGGSKVHPEEVEAVINRHPDVRMSLVRAKRNPITGSVVVADVVLADARADNDAEVRKSAVKHEIIGLCRESLAQYKVPVIISFVPGLAIAESGKIARHHA